MNLHAARALAALPSADERRAVAMYADGAPTALIRRLTGVGSTRLYRLCREQNVAQRPRGRPRRNA